MNQLPEGIRLIFPDDPPEHVRLATSRLWEAVQCWHVLADPGHHALHLPWVRTCRRLPEPLRRLLREYSWVVRGYLPTFFEAGIGHPDSTIEDELARIRSVPPGNVLQEFVLTVVDAPVRDGLESAAVQGRVLAAARDEVAADRLRRVFEDPVRLRDDVLSVLVDYWRAGFSAEYDRLAPVLHHAMVGAARVLAAEGPLGLLGGLVPAVVPDPARHTVLVPRSHRHRVAIADHGGITLVPSLYAWPHVRVTCDHPPWPLTLTYPVDRLVRPLSRTLTPAQLGHQLRAIAGGPRLEILHLASVEPRSTQELAHLTQLSEAAISKHLQVLLRTGLVTRRRDGYYVLYQADASSLTAITNALARYVGTPLAPPE